MNKTLSLIEEENEEDNFTVEDKSGGNPNGFGDSQKIFIEDTLRELSIQGTPEKGGAHSRHSSYQQPKSTSLDA